MNQTLNKLTEKIKFLAGNQIMNYTFFQLFKVIKCCNYNRK